MSDDNAPDDPEYALAMTYAPIAARASLAALLGLDAALAAVLRTTTEAAIAQIRLAWWRERLGEVGSVATPAMPVLQAIADHVVARGVAGERLVEIVEGWEVLIEAERLDEAALVEYAQKRGGGLFDVAGSIVGVDVSRRAGEGWALADLTRHLENTAEADLARQLANDRLASWKRWPRQSRVLGAWAAIARMDLAMPLGAQPPIGSPRRVARLAWMRLTGR